MSKPSLKPPMNKLESDMVETLIGGLHEWRPDLQYPESHSDMQACVRGLLQMYEIKRLPVPRRLEFEE